MRAFAEELRAEGVTVDWARGRKGLGLEHFYRHMRSQTGLLMDGDKPAGGAWNFDQSNRKPLPEEHASTLPLRFPPDAETQAVIDLVADRFPDHFGTLDGFPWAVTRSQALEALDRFI